MKSLPVSIPQPFATFVQLTAGVLSGQREGTPDGSPYEPRRSLADRFEAWLWHLRQRDLERALATSTDLADLERRLRDEADLFRRYY
jgi:hypothetical protein